MDSSGPSNGLTVFPPDVEDSQTDYKQRCKYLEGQLEKFREQATKVREVIGQKLKDLEQKSRDSDAKAAETSLQVKRLESLVAVKEETVAQLRIDLENEKQRRILREREVEDKAAHIKGWMQKKMTEYEDKLRDVNAENDQLKSSQRQAMEMVREIETKLHFSQEQVVRLSRELADVQSHYGDYAVVEPDAEQTEESMCQSPLNSPDSEQNTDALFISPDGEIEASLLSPGTFSHGEERDYRSLGQDEPVEISIKRTSSGKSPSKIPRYVGSSEDPRSAQISYYMSLKRGLKSPNDSKPKFFIQVQDSTSPNPYMHLMQTENQNLLQKKHFNSQSTVDSERDSVFEPYFQSNEENADGFHAQTGDLVTLCLETRSLAPSMTRTEQDFLSESRSSLDSTSEPQHILPNPVYQTLEQTLESELLLSPPPPPVPPRFDQGNSVPPPIPPVPKSKEVEVERTEGNFTSYLPLEEVSKEDKESNGLDSGENQSWNWNDSPGSDSPLFGTLEKCSKELNLLMEQTCPVYTTLKGRASQIRNIPFSGESTDSSDNESMADYCTPPDEEVSGDEEESQVNDRTDQTIEGSKQVLKTCATYTTVNLKKEDQRKEGYLTKLGGRIKNWKRRWFVLRDGKLYYYKSQQDVNRKPLGQIPLDGTCRIARTEGALTFEVATPKRTFYLTGETREVVDEWLRVLHNVMRKFSTTPLFAQVNEKEIMRGSLTKVKHGASKKCWCVLRGQYLCFYKSEDDAVPFSVTNMIDVIVEEFETPDSEDGHDANPPYRHYTLVMKSLKQPATTYLLIDSKAEKDSWLFHLKVASGSGIDDMGTAFEESIFQLIAQDCDPESDLWNNYVLTHVKEPITEPLTTLPSKELENEALKLFKSVHLFTTVQTEEAAIDYHVSLAQNALQTCLNYPELQNEVYCQLIKQTSKHVHRGPHDLGDFLESCGKSSWLREDSFAIASQATIDLRPVQEFVYIQAWQLLALCTSIFVPKQKFLLFLKGHLNRNSAVKTKVGKFASYCLKNLERTLANGKRETRPSRMEVISVLLRKPYDHSCPMSIPVHFIDGTSQVFGFDGSTTIQEFTRTINMVVGIRTQSESGYALFTDNPVNLMEHCLQSSVKLCDVISKWEQAMRSQSQGKLDTSRIIKLTYKNRLYFKSLSSNETDKEKFFLVLQANANVMKGRFPVSKEMALELAALMAQITYGDYRAHSNSLPSKRIEIVISKFCAKTILEDTGKRSLTLRMAEKWSTLHGWSLKESVDKYLENTRRWPFFGCKLFQAQQKHTLSAAKKRAAQSENTQPVWLAVEEDSINILEGESLRLMCRYKYKHVVTFGGWKDDFMLVVNQSIMRGGNTVEQGTQRLLFVMSKGKILELTLLMASYINAIIRQKGITCDVSETPANRQGMDVKVWDLESSEWPIVPGATVGLL